VFGVVIILPWKTYIAGSSSLIAIPRLTLRAGVVLSKREVILFAFHLASLIIQGLEARFDNGAYSGARETVLSLRAIFTIPASIAVGLTGRAEFTGFLLVVVVRAGGAIFAAYKF